MTKRKIKIGVVGCGAIGSRFAKSIKHEFKNDCTLSGIYDIDIGRAQKLSKELSLNNIIRTSLNDLIKTCDFVVEAVNTPDAKNIIRQALLSKKSVLAMSVGRLLTADNLFSLAKKNHCTLLLPSGALSGLDAVKAASLTKIQSVTLTTRKPPSGFEGIPYIVEKGIDLKQIKRETILYDGDVKGAVEIFPKNINVAATLALACGLKGKMQIKIIASPFYKTNSHEVEIIGDFGRMTSRTDNVVCPDNPKTSYLAVLSAIQTLKQFFSPIKIGT